jgi:uncharacterized protein (TIGR02300 family)
VAKSDWGTKRICQSCATKFYDFGRAPIACPKCGTTFDPETLLKSRRRPPAASKPVKAVKAPAPAKDDDEEEDIEIDDDIGEIDDDDDDAVLEDASDLEDDDVAEVVSPAESDEEER